MNYYFLFKLMMREYPSRMIAVMSTFITFFFGYLIMLADRPFYDAIGTEISNWELFFQSSWLSIITATTVGYGGVIPKTLVSRVLIVIVVILGAFVTGLLIGVLSNSIEFESA